MYPLLFALPDKTLETCFLGSLCAYFIFRVLSTEISEQPLSLVVFGTLPRVRFNHCFFVFGAPRLRATWHTARSLFPQKYRVGVFCGVHLFADRWLLALIRRRLKVVRCLLLLLLRWCCLLSLRPPCIPLTRCIYIYIYICTAEGMSSSQQLLCAWCFSRPFIRPWMSTIYK